MMWRLELVTKYDVETRAYELTRFGWESVRLIMRDHMGHTRVKPEVREP